MRASSTHLLNLTEDTDVVTAQLGGGKLDGALREVDEAGRTDFLHAQCDAWLSGVGAGVGMGQGVKGLREGEETAHTYRSRG